MHNNGQYDYGLWWMVAINSFIVLAFSFSFFHPKSRLEWRSFGVFSAFIIALFTEMYGFPLTIYLLSGWLASHFPDINIFSHQPGHLWWVLFGGNSNPHFDLFHILSNIAIIGGLWIIAAAWRVLHQAQQSNSLACSGIYTHIRHPQYLGFILVMLGFLLQWPTLPTLIMFPVLVWIYRRLAQREERIALQAFSHDYQDYINHVPAFIPHFIRWSPWKH